MVETELSSPPPLKPSHCASPPLHNSPFVSSLLVVCFSTTLGPFWFRRRLCLCDSEQGPIRGQSPKLTPHFRVFGLTFTTPPNAHSAERSRGVSTGRAGGQGERERHAQSNEVCLESALLTAWLTPSLGHNGASHL